MKKNEYQNFIIDQSIDVIWIVNQDFQLVYANKSYFSFMIEATGEAKKLKQSAFIKFFGEEDIQKWKAYYKKALKGDYFEIEEHFYNEKSNEIKYNQITFEPLTDEQHKVFAVACRSKDITRIIQERSEVNQLMDASLDVFCTINEQGNFVYVSAACKKLWGYSPKELIGKSNSNLTLQEDVTKKNEITEAILSSQDIKSFVNRYKKKKGEIAYNSWSGRWDKSSKLMYCVVRDAKEKIKEEEKTLQSEQRFKDLVQEGSDLIGIIDKKGKYTYISPTSTTILGVEPKEIIGKKALDFVHPDDLERVLSSLKKIKTEKKLVLEPFRLQNRKKEWRWVESVLTNMLDNNAVNGIVSNARDITAKIEEQDRLKLLESVITNTTDAILITEVELQQPLGPKIIFVNEAFTKMTGYSSEDAIGKTPRILQGPNSNREELAKLSRSLKKFEPYEMTTINYKKSGEEFWINFTVTPVANEQGRYTHYIATERDVTEKITKELEKELTDKIGEIFNQNIDNDTVECLSSVCQQIAKFGDFDFSEIWLPAIDTKTINLVTNYSQSKAGNIFYDKAKDLDSYVLGETFTGYVWKNEKTEIIGDDDENWRLFKRGVFAKKAGIKAIMMVPLKHKKEVIGVLLLGTKKTKSDLVLYLPLFQKLELTIGAQLSRKKVETELAQIFNFTPDMICVADFDGYIKRMNPAGLEILGYSLEEICSRPLKSFIHEEDRLQTQEKLTGLFKGESVRKFENRYITKKGKIVWLSWTASPVLEHGMIYAVAKNITEEKKLRELNSEVGRLLKIGGWEFDIVNETLYWSNEVHQLHKTDPNSFLPTLENAINFYRADFREIVRLKVEECIATGKTIEFEAVIVTAEKKELWVRARGNSEFVDGKCKRIYGSFQDIHEQKLAAIELEQSLKELRDYKFSLDQSAIISFADKKGVITSVNDNFCNISKYEREEIIGKSHHLINSHYNSKEFFNDVWKTIESGNVWRGELKSKDKDGFFYWEDTTIVPFLNKKKKPTQYLAIRFDITNRKETEQEKNILRETIENSLNEIFMFDSKTFHFSYVNQGALTNLGYSEDEIKVLTPIDIKQGVTRASFKKIVAPLVNNEKEKIVFFANHKRKDNTFYPVEVHLQLVEQGITKSFLAVILDITERKKSEQVILKSNERFEIVTEATNDTIWDWDIVQKTFYRSKAIEKFFGKKAPKLMIESDFWQGNFYPDDKEKIQKSVDDAIADPLCNRWEQEYRIINYQEEIIYVIDRGVIIRDEEGKAIRMVGAMTDISEQKQMDLKLRDVNQELQQHTLELERSNKELEHFAFVASHDLQEPLRMVSSFMDLLKRKYGNQFDEKGHQYIHFATDGAKKMKQIILDLLDYSRAGKLTEELVAFDLNKTLEDYKTLRRKIIEEKKVIILNDSLPLVTSYKVPLTQAIHSILDNAIKYSKEDVQPKIEICVSENEKDWIIEVKDNGIGIDKHFFEKIFIIFQRLHDKDKYEGTGIGLSIAKKNIESCNGKIWVESTVNKGSTFYFTINKIKQ